MGARLFRIVSSLGPDFTGPSGGFYFTNGLSRPVDLATARRVQACFGNRYVGLNEVPPGFRSDEALAEHAESVDAALVAETLAPPEGSLLEAEGTTVDPANDPALSDEAASEARAVVDDSPEAEAARAALAAPVEDVPVEDVPVEDVPVPPADQITVVANLPALAEDPAALAEQAAALDTEADVLEDMAEDARADATAAKKKAAAKKKR